ncbi:MAG: DUF2306 domain-containing protein [Burkholderiales bacterium]
MAKVVTPVVYVHLFAALAALLFGIVQLARPKGTPSHKAIGWTWVLLMATVAISSLWIPSFLHFTWIHVFTLVTAIALPAGIIRIRRGNVAGHARTMTLLFVGALAVAGAFTLVPGRLLGNLLWKGCWSC